jgi:hypothetical protein
MNQPQVVHFHHDAGTILESVSGNQGTPKIKQGF